MRKLLARRGYAHACARIRLLCYPRILGYVFNPLSVYFCYDADDQLQVILYEVTNTFRQRHTYLIPAGSAEKLQHSCDKQMYVSPFMPLDTRYSFTIRPPGSAVSVGIRQHDLQQQLLFKATFAGQQETFCDAALLKLFISHPLMTLKVMVGIHWEALRLWRKSSACSPEKKAPGTVSAGTTRTETSIMKACEIKHPVKTPDWQEKLFLRYLRDLKTACRAGWNCSCPPDSSIRQASSQRRQPHCGLTAGRH
ncbi:DUF1365 domain-containing protein [Aliamphritea spongicola]|nr:DUF1365 domain-containing protein [Aliamphritea spongicola]